MLTPPEWATVVLGFWVFWFALTGLLIWVLARLLEQ